MDEVRASHARAVEESERLVDAFFVPLAKNVQAIIEDVGRDRALTMADYGAIMARIDRELSRVYPSAPGGWSPLEEAIVLACNRSRVRAIKVNMAPVVRAIRRIDPVLLRDLHG